MRQATIAVDAMGGDHGVANVVGAVNKFLEKNNAIKFLLVGNENVVKGFTLHKNIKVVHAEHSISMNDSPVEAIRAKRNSSIKVALDLVKNGEADAFVSTGSTGAIVALAKLTLGTIAGVKRPVLAAEAVDCFGRSRLFLDLGANVDCSAKMLHQFAILGHKAYKMLHKDQQEPKTALFNVGREQVKGSVIIKEAAQLLDADTTINYAGFVEGDQVVGSDADIIVVDGFTGNIALKSVEGAIKVMLGDKSLLRDILLLLFKKQIKKRIALRPGPAAMLLGIKKPVFKIHGSAKQEHIIQALNVVSNMIGVVA